ncbi:mechanosensitive ion channel family protein [Salibacter halophilus]|jgi:miniconductance mechanosensitive channel|nr:mechanosensitive ion channel domain-containing protein [Salibacter halophilus]
MDETQELGNQIGNWLGNILQEMGVAGSSLRFVKMLVLLALTIIIALLIDFIVRKILVNFLHHFANKSKTNFDDHLIERNITRYISQWLPAIFVSAVIPVVFHDFDFLITPLTEIVDIYLFIVIALFIQALLQGSRDYLLTKDKFKDKPIQSLAQLLNIASWIVVAILIFSELTEKSVTNLFAALGAASAVLLLIFKDTILGFVGSIQLSYNDMVRVGDWIVMSKYGADGNVTVINLNTVKVLNWDNTITNVPTYALISDSFINYRNMEEGPGRRIQKAIYIKQSTVRFLEKNDLDKLKGIQLINKYIDTRQADIDSHNEKNNIDKSLAINGRNQTNLGIFRKYLLEYLRQNPIMRKDMKLMARQLHPTEHGIPIEIYGFSKIKSWVDYEYVMGEIFDHAIASVKYFDLELFEIPAGSDITPLKLQHNGDVKTGNEAQESKS